MASIRKRSKSRFWYAVVRGPDGHARHFSTGLTDRAEALAVAVATERTLLRHADKPHQLRAALDRLAGDFVPAEEENPAAWLEAWLKRRRGEVAPSTAAAYETTIKEAAEWLRAEGVAAFTKLTPARIAELRDSWARVSAVSANKKMKHLKIALADAVREGRIEESPAAGIARLREEKSNRREFRKEELDRLLSEVAGEWAGLVWLGLSTGQRLNDLAGIRAESIDLKAKTITFEAGKTGALVGLPLLPAALRAVSGLLKGKAPGDPVFPSILASAPSSRSNAFRGILARCGLANDRNTRNAKKPGAARTTSELSFHSLRHTTTTLLKAAGVSDAVARAIIGHESRAVSRRYTHLDIETMREAMERVEILSTDETPRGRPAR